jgi:hypothetical protein
MGKNGKAAFRRVKPRSPSAPQTSSDHLDRWLSNPRKRPPQSGLVQVGFSAAIGALLLVRLPGLVWAHLGSSDQRHELLAPTSVRFSERPPAIVRETIRGQARRLVEDATP